MRNHTRLISALVILAGISAIHAPAESAGATDSAKQLGKIELIRLLDDESIYKRIFAAYNIGNRDINARDRLVKLTNSDSPWMRRSAVFALGLHPDESILPVFKRALSDENYGVRRSATIAIGNMRSSKCVNLLSKALDDPDFGVREMALIAIAMNNYRDLIPRVIASLKDESMRVRRTAAAVLGEFGDKQAATPLKELMTKIDAGEVKESDNKAVKAQLNRPGTYPYGFIHFPELIDKFSADSGIDVRVNDEVLYGMYINAQNPDNLDSVKMKFYNTPTGETLSKICNTLGSYYYVESGTVNIAAKSYLFFDTDLEFEVAAALYRLGDRSQKKTIEKYRRRDIYEDRVKALLR